MHLKFLPAALCAIATCGVSTFLTVEAQADTELRSPKRLLLIGGPYDGHPPGTHDFMAGIQIIAEMLEEVDGLDVTVTNSTEPWSVGPESLDAADGVVLFAVVGFGLDFGFDSGC